MGRKCKMFCDNKLLLYKQILKPAGLTGFQNVIKYIPSFQTKVLMIPQLHCGMCV